MACEQGKIPSFVALDEEGAHSVESQINTAYYDWNAVLTQAANLNTL